MDDNIIVSVICLAYNHEKYIRYALDSIIEQQTKFKYEIVVHDDNSTDGTKKIIEEYKSKYPNLIVPIYEDENQYSRGKKVFEMTVKYTSGKYIAVCECDDFWCDKNKLQRQVEFLEDNSEYVACATSSLIMDDRTLEKREMFHVDEDIDLSIIDIVEWDKRHYQTGSLMFRREYAFVPQKFSIPGVGDYPRALYMRANGRIRYFKDIMTVYRAFSDGSWSSNLMNDSKMFFELDKNTLHMLKLVRDDLPIDFKDVIDNKIRLLEFRNNLYLNNYLEIKKNYRDYYDKMSYKERTIAQLRYYMPWLYNILKKIKNN